MRDQGETVQPRARVRLHRPAQRRRLPLRRAFQLADQRRRLAGQADDGQLPAFDRQLLQVGAVRQPARQFVHHLDRRRPAVALPLQVGAAFHRVQQALPLRPDFARLFAAAGDVGLQRVGGGAAVVQQSRQPQHEQQQRQRGQRQVPPAPRVAARVPPCRRQQVDAERAAFGIGQVHPGQPLRQRAQPRGLRLVPAPRHHHEFRLQLAVAAQLQQTPVVQHVGGGERGLAFDLEAQYLAQALARGRGQRQAAAQALRGRQQQPARQFGDRFRQQPGQRIACARGRRRGQGQRQGRDVEDALRVLAPQPQAIAFQLQ